MLLPSVCATGCPEDRTTSAGQDSLGMLLAFQMEQPLLTDVDSQKFERCIQLIEEAICSHHPGKELFDFSSWTGLLHEYLQFIYIDLDFIRHFFAFLLNET